jgi:FixJ family two-component response regulator
MSRDNFVVFLVDNEHSVVSAMTRLLEAHDYQVRRFSSAHEFLAAHDPAAPGCVIVDVRSPGQLKSEIAP